VEDLAADVVPYMDAVGIDEAILVGHSGSCLVARRVAIDSPERVAGLVLEAAPTTLRGDPGLTAFVDSVVSGLTDPIDPDFVRSVVVGTSSPAVDRDMVDVLAAEILKVPARVWRETFAGLLEYDDTAELGRIAVPTLLVWGDGDPLVGRDEQDLLGRLIPEATLLVYAAVGHTPRWEEPDRFAAHAAAFREKVCSTSRRSANERRAAN
jgi:pimeloyl-ACP methyl ester carboxylesterase